MYVVAVICILVLHFCIANFDDKKKVKKIKKSKFNKRHKKIKKVKSEEKEKEQEAEIADCTEEKEINLKDMAIVEIIST